MKRTNPDVEKAVHDIMHGVAADTHTEWLQREYQLLMVREFSVVALLEKQRVNAPQQSDSGRKHRPLTAQHTRRGPPPVGTARRYGGNDDTHRENQQHVKHEPGAHFDALHPDTE